MTARMRVFSAMTRNHLEMTLKVLTFSQVTSPTRILRLTTRSACRITADKAISPDASRHSKQQDESSLQADLQSYVAQKGCSRGSGKLYTVLAAGESNILQSSKLRHLTLVACMRACKIDTRLIMAV